MVCATLGVEDCGFTNGAAYVASWLTALRNDRNEIFRAASDAQRIADYLLAFHPDYAQPVSREEDAAPEGDINQTGTEPLPVTQAALPEAA